jgi:hypothetical protein
VGGEEVAVDSGVVVEPAGGGGAAAPGAFRGGWWMTGRVSGDPCSDAGRADYLGEWRRGFCAKRARLITFSFAYFPGVFKIVVSSGVILGSRLHIPEG